MLLSIVPVGTSSGVRIPASVLRSLGVKRGDRLFARVEGGSLVLSRGPSHPKLRAFMDAVGPMPGRGVLLVWLFGSFTTPRWSPEKSDIDLYVVVARESAETEVMELAARLDLRLEGPPLAPVVYGLRRVDWTWFEDEVMGGFPLYIDPKAFPRGVPPPRYLKEMGGLLVRGPSVHAE